MVVMRNRISCCSREREMSVDFDDQNGVTTYDGLESCIEQSQSHENGSPSSRGDKSVTEDSLFDDDSSSVSSNTGLGSFSSHWTEAKTDDPGADNSDKWESSESPQHSWDRQDSGYRTGCSEVDKMKEEFSKLLLGEDMTGGSKGVSTALALSNAITNLSVTVFGDMMKLEPLSEDNKRKWQMEMDWLLSPTKYMVELVPAKQSGANGITFEIMTSQVRQDIHMNLPALQKLDSMLIDTLDSMDNSEFWYAEVGSREDGGQSGKSVGQSKRWYVPITQIPQSGLSDAERKKLLDNGKLVNQIFKAATAINENVLYEMPVPSIITDSLPKTSKLCLGDELYKILTTEPSSSVDMFNSLKLKSENTALEVINKLETSILMWKERIQDQAENGPPPRSTWSFMKDPSAEVDRMEHLRNKAEALLLQIKIRYPNLPHTFVDNMKIQHSKDIGHSIVEAYSRILGSLAYSVLTRIGEIMQEDILINPNSPAVAYHFPGMSDWTVHSEGLRHSSVVDMMNEAPDFGTCLF
ncbi:PREDICTED: rop guanine nucleotide exchange factor 14-like [Ipomoea nil]|uniref:rop guanine nucleotide exchange factor 14-like n=1 Tax=Ipomoea nil TaxID=35883 RepID=UPI0009012E55|nr:PREDICTED: rop guanine nucleotide exchange factor 14-like [Ipomoea nil]XP_019153371.1 PREDICTED: rop guanine nucleotide exchange factor 14-like [Ipomoea nil]XP_019153372.1 PREDICTED: rop guanine nucleotide exchange factor 14-like [Ipomoea nil]XP_019153373.1 PREDICTED: rop guanine nucleotide exchange factor 14-like [Ipomoea nil]